MSPSSLAAECCESSSPDLLVDPLLIDRDEMCSDCQTREPGTSYMETPTAGIAFHNVRTRSLPDSTIACRVCGVRVQPRYEK